MTEASSQGTCRVDALLRDARARVDGAEAEMLMAHVLGRPRSWLFAHRDAVLQDEAVIRFEALLSRREQGEPLAYIIGHRGFWTLDLAVTPDTLVPRADTEVLVAAALARLPPHASPRIADLGTGSGAIALALASERPGARVVATDRSEAALAVAKGNAIAHGLGNVTFLAGDWFAPLQDESFDLVASNPPYIAGDDPHLAQGDLRFEPRPALTPEGDGLQAIREIVAHAPSHLDDGGWLLVEHGHDQGEAVRALFVAAGFGAVETVRDLEHRERVTLGRWR